MKSEDIKLSDWTRILFGEAPPLFYLELIIRAVLIYALLMVSMRFLGKRMATQVSRLELAAMVALASAIGVPMLSPSNGLLPAFIIAAVVVGVSRLVAKISFGSERFEKVTQGNIDLLVEESVMHQDIMKKTRISRERLFAQLRSENVNHLGKVKRMYLEANGSFTLVENDDVKPGLMVLPDWDTDFINEQLNETDTVVCNNCGATKPANIATHDGAVTCSNCSKNEWTKAVIEKQPAD